MGSCVMVVVGALVATIRVCGVLYTLRNLNTNELLVYCSLGVENY